MSRSKPEAKYIQLATLSDEGFVQNRTLVFRGFVDESDHIIMITDTRSDKFLALQAHSHAEICWYFAKTREQYRLSGNINIFANTSDLRTSVWNKISPSAKAQFYWYLDDKLVNELSLNNSIPDTFCVLL
ncbi:MAG: pyridoxamine 5'-phosphate oxidase family protein, partial [Glaciecola sp.]